MSSVNSAGMKRLLDCYDQYALEQDLVYIGGKYGYMLFRPKRYTSPFADLYLAHSSLIHANSHKHL